MRETRGRAATDPAKCRKLGARRAAHPARCRKSRPRQPAQHRDYLKTESIKSLEDPESSKSVAARYMGSFGRVIRRTSSALSSWASVMRPAATCPRSMTISRSVRPVASASFATAAASS